MPNGNEIVNGDIRPTLFIGLGGTGKEVLLRLRRKFYERLRMPGLPCTAYLWIDTDTRDLDAQGQKMDEIFQAVRFREEEQVGLLNGRVGDDLGQIFTNPEQWPHIHRWLHDEVKRYGAEISDGAGGVRAIGRLTFFHHYAHQISQAVGTALASVGSMNSIRDTQQLFRERNMGSAAFSAGVQVFIVSSIAGGTGCGTFLDTVFHLRRLKSRGGANIDRLHGILFMPNVYYGENRTEMAQRSFGNAYAALKELEFYSLRMPTTGEEDQSVDYIVEWNRGNEEKIAGPPFSIAYLQEMKNEAGVSLEPRSRHELFTMVAESLYADFMPSQFSTAKRSHYSNVAQFLSGSRSGNVSSGGVSLPQVFARRYASFGMSKIEIPIDAIQGACAAKLSAEILNYINRDSDAADIKTNVLDDLAGFGLDAQGIRDRFGASWKDEIRSAVGNAIRANPVKEAADVQRLEQQLREVDVRLVRADGSDSTKWGVLVDSARRKTGTVSADAQASLTEWIQNSCLENDARGLKVLLADDGYLRHASETLKALYLPTEAGAKADYDILKSQAQSDSAFYEEVRKNLLQDLRGALKSFSLAALGAKSWSVDKLLQRLNESQEQYLFAKMDECLLDESKKVAKACVEFLLDRKRSMDKFLQTLSATAAAFEEKSQEFLNFGASVLMIRLYDPDKDWDAFYRLDVDEQNAPRHVNRKLEYKYFLDQKLTGAHGLLDLIELQTKTGIEEVKRRISSYCEDRFWNDFRGHPRPLNLLDHKQMSDRRQEVVEQLVRAARPMMRQNLSLAGTSIITPKLAYMGICETDTEPYASFVNEVRNHLVVAGYRELNVSPTGRPEEIYLYLVNYAFPLPALPVVTNECHTAYNDFYRSLREGRIGDSKGNIELHLSKTWEGKFGDLLIYSDEDARRIKDATSILLFGAMLRVVSVKIVKGQQQFSLKLGPPLFTMEPLGTRREAIERLRADNGIKQMLLAAIEERERKLTKEQVLAFYWAIQYLRFSSEFAPGSPEITLLEMKLTSTSVVLQQHGFTEKQLDVPQEDGADKAEHCKTAAVDTLEWFNITFPIVKTLDAWTKPAVAATA